MSENLVWYCVGPFLLIVLALDCKTKHALVLVDVLHMLSLWFVCVVLPSESNHMSS